MSDSWDKIISDIKQDVGKIANKIARGVAQVALFELQEAHSEILDDFYGGYTPVKSYHYITYAHGRLWAGQTHGYRRTGNLRKSINPREIVQVGKHGFIAGVDIGPINMDGYINSTGRVFPASEVFDYIWNFSNRGLPPGYKGHIGEFSISAAPAGIAISGSPHEAMSQFVEGWGVRAGEVADLIANGL